MRLGEPAAIFADTQTSLAEVFESFETSDLALIDAFMRQLATRARAGMAWLWTPGRTHSHAIARTQRAFLGPCRCRSAVTRGLQ